MEDIPDALPVCLQIVADVIGLLLQVGTSLWGLVAMARGMGFDVDLPALIRKVADGIKYAGDLADAPRKLRAAFTALSALVWRDRPASRDERPSERPQAAEDDLEHPTVCLRVIDGGKCWDCKNDRRCPASCRLCDD